MIYPPMNMEEHKTMPQSERDELNKQLDVLRQHQQESVHEKPSDKTSDENKRSCWGCLIGMLAALGGLLLFWRTACRPIFIMCYSPVPDRVRNEEDIKPTCYEIAIPDENDIPDTDFPPMELKPERESTTTDAEADAALEEVQQYYEKVKRESPVNNVDNAETKDEPTK